MMFKGRLENGAQCTLDKNNGVLKDGKGMKGKMAPNKRLKILLYKR